MLIEEHWATIQDFPNYAVSNYGQVLNLRTRRVLKNSADPKGYERVCLTGRDGTQFFMVHRLVAEYFLADFDEDLEVKHKNNNLSDNGILNLYMGERRARARDI